MASYTALWEKSDALHETVREYISSGLLVEAIPAALQIPLLSKQTDSMLHIYDSIIDKYGIEKAFQIASKFPDLISTMYVNFCYQWTNSKTNDEKLRAYSSLFENFSKKKIKNQEPLAMRFLTSLAAKDIQLSRGQALTGVDASTAGKCLFSLETHAFEYVKKFTRALVRRREYIKAMEVCLLHYDFHDLNGDIISSAIFNNKKDLALEMMGMLDHPHPESMHKWIKKFVPKDQYRGKFWSEGVDDYLFSILDVECEEYFVSYARMCIDYKYIEEAKKISRGFQVTNNKKQILDRIFQSQSE
jgi:hypothetical protein